MDTGSINVAGPQLAQVAIPNGSLAIMAPIASHQPSEDYPRMSEVGAGMALERDWRVDARALEV